MAIALYKLPVRQTMKAKSKPAKLVVSRTARFL
jgi:hypothetical protein